MDINKLHKVKRERDIIQKKTWHKIFLMCIRKIELANKIFEEECFFEIPDMIIGHPKYNIDDVIKYLVKNLKKIGYYLEVYQPNIIYINWNEDLLSMKNKINKNNQNDDN